MRGGSKGVIIPHRHEGVFIFKTSNSDALLTKNLVPGESFHIEIIAHNVFISIMNE
ncbi:fibrillarin protein [Medicago truncatula]|uniref:Fibrillarin protein n=1 Tax=Medicago truncatula TaxID=3880 RepID=G7LBP8_MEDTR|nr:fibrillarin protein [Medicago truncatula]